MELDELTPTGTFVEFSWHSFDEDGPLDLTPRPIDVTEHFVTHGVLRALEGETGPLSERQVDTDD